MYNNKNRNKGVKIKLGLICAFFAIVLGCAAVLLCNPFGAQKSTQLAASAETENTAKVEDITAPTLNISSTAATVNSGITASAMATAWNNAINQSINGTQQVTLNLQADWTGTYGTGGFGSGVGFKADSNNDGSILVPAGADILLNLNGFTIKSTIDGGAIYVYGKLTLGDTAGTITSKGGAEGAALNVSNGGTFIMNGGSIANSRSAEYDVPGGVSLECNSTFSLTGGTITGNAGVYGGGVCV